MIDVRAEVLEADTRIRQHIRRTPIEESMWLAEQAGCKVHLKLENLQATSSFKLRGAANRLLSLDDSQRSKGVVTASTGNHGSAVAYLLRQFDWPGVVYLPETATKAKVRALEQKYPDFLMQPASSGYQDEVSFDDIEIGNHFLKIGAVFYL